jgi:hypothetical protein
MEDTQNTNGAGAGPDSGQIRAAAAASVAPDPVTAELLAKHSAGEKLSPAENGKIGAFKARMLRLLPGMAGPKSGQVMSKASPGQPAGMGADASVEASAGGMEPVSVDADLVRRTTASLLKSSDQIARRYVGNKARKVTQDEKRLARFDSAVGLPTASQELIADISPEILTSLGMDPRSYPVTVAVGMLGLWATNIWLVVEELNKLAEAQKPKAVAPAPEGETIPIRAGSLPYTDAVATEGGKVTTDGKL